MTPLARAVEAMLRAERFDWLRRADRWIVYSRSALDACVQPIAVYDTETEAMETAKRMTARAALLAALGELRESNEAMIEAHMGECAGDAAEAGPKSIRLAWAAMIDVLIEEAGNEANR